jgi:hypothetical protein
MKTTIPTTIKTNERIIKIITFDGETILCNVDTAKTLLQNQEIKHLFHFWNGEFKRFSKLDLKAM